VFIDRVQVDPFASPSKVRVRIDRAEAGFPTDITTDGADRIAVADFLLRTGTKALADLGQRAIILGRPGQEILERTNVRIDDDGFEDRKSTRLNSSHVSISYAVFCLKKKNQINTAQ